MDDAYLERYIEMATSLMDSFRYEYCDQCGQDLNAHAILADNVFGLPYAKCLASIKNV